MVTASPVELPQLPKGGYVNVKLNRDHGYWEFDPPLTRSDDEMRQYGQQCYEAGVRAQTLRLEVIRAYLAGMEELAALGPTSLDWHAQRLLTELLDPAAAIRKGE